MMMVLSQFEIYSKTNVNNYNLHNMLKTRLSMVVLIFIKKYIRTNIDNFDFS